MFGGRMSPPPPPQKKQYNHQLTHTLSTPSAPQQSGARRQRRGSERDDAKGSCGECVALFV